MTRPAEARGASCQRSTVRLSEDTRPFERVSTANPQSVEQASPETMTLILRLPDSKLRLSFSGDSRNVPGVLLSREGWLAGRPGTLLVVQKRRQNAAQIVRWCLILLTDPFERWEDSRI